VLQQLNQPKLLLLQLMLLLQQLLWLYARAHGKK
jgi:hypothetical protein